jgi:hypothetical protein
MTWYERNGKPHARTDGIPLFRLPKYPPPPINPKASTDGDVLVAAGETAMVAAEGGAGGLGEAGDGRGPKKDSKEAELKRKVALGLQKKLDDDLATMFNAIEEGDMEAVKLLLDKGFKPNEVDYDCRSGLHFAAAKGEDKIVELLIQRGADVHLRDRWGRNALQDAIDSGHATVTSMLAAQVRPSPSR